MYRHYLTPPSNGFGNSNFQSAGDHQNELFVNAHNTSSSSKANLPFSSTFYGGSKRAHNTTYTNNRVDFSPYSANSKAAAGESYSYASGTSRLSEKGQQQQQPQNSNASPLFSMSQRKQQDECFTDFVNESAFSQPLTSCKKQLNFNNCSNSNSNNSAEWQQQQQQQSRQNQVYDLLSRFREASNSRLADNSSAKTEGRLYVSAQKNTLNNQSTTTAPQSALAQQMESAFKQLQSKEQQQRNLQLTPSRSGAPLASSSASSSATPSKQQIQVQIREPLRPMNSYSNYQQQQQAEEINISSKRNHYSPLNNKNNSNSSSNNNLCYQGSQQQFQQQQTSASHSRNCSPLSSLLKPLSICFNTASHNSRSLTPVNNNNNHNSNATNITNPNMNSSRNNNSTTKQQSSSSFSQQRPSVHQQNYLRNYLMPKQSQQPNTYSKLQQCLTPPSQKKQSENYGTLTQESSFSNVQNPHNNSSRGRPSEEYASSNIQRTPSKTPVAIPCNNNFFEAWNNNNNNSSAGQKSQMMMKPCFNPQSHMNSSNYSNNDNSHNFSGNFANLASSNNKSRSASPLVKNDCSKNNIFNFVNDKDQSHFSCHNYDYSTIINNQTTNNINTNNTPSAMTSTTTGGMADNFTAFIMNHTNNNILSSHNNLSREGSPFQTPLKSACSSILQPTQYGIASSEKQSKSHVQQTNNLLFQSAAADSPRFNDQMDLQIKNARNNNNNTTTTLNVINNNNNNSNNNIVIAKANSYSNNNSANQGIHVCQDAMKMTHSGNDMYPNEECAMNQLPVSLHAQHSPIMNTLIDGQHTQTAIDINSHHMNNQQQQHHQQQQQLAANHNNPMICPSGDIFPNNDVLSNYRQKQIVYEEAIDQADQGVKNVFKKFDVLLKTRLEALAQSKSKSNNANNNINYHNNTNSNNSLNNSTNHSNNGRVLLSMKPINPFNLPVSSYEPVFVTHDQKLQQPQQQPLQSGINVPSAVSAGINQFTIPTGKLSQAAVVVTPIAAGGNNNIPERSALSYQPQQQQVIVKSQPQQQQHQQPLITTTLVKNNINTTNTPTPIPSNSSKNEPIPIEMTKQLEKFSLGKILGYGSYAVVRVVEDTTTNLKYALKTYEKKKLADPQKRKNVAREVKILSKLKNSNIVRLYDVIETNSQLHLLMEYPTATALSVHIRSQINRRLTEEEAKVTFIQLVQAVMYCHRKSVVHRDIKLENVLYEPSTATVKLIDFGFAIALAPGAKLNIFCGTPSYMAPEIVNKKEYTFPVDTWALGVLLYKALNGVFPFRGADDKELFRKINACKLEFQPFVSQPARNLLGKILRVNPGDRLTPEQILQDEWLVSKPPAGPLPFGTTSSTQSSSGVQVSASANTIAAAVPLQ